MHILLTTYPNKGRDLKRFIDGIIKGGLAGCVQKINYVKSYYIHEGKIKKEDEKILLIKCADQQKEKLSAYIEKNHPSTPHELTRLTPTQVNDAYNMWIQEPRTYSSKKNSS